MKAYQIGKYSVYAARSIEEALSIHPPCTTDYRWPAKELPDDWVTEVVEGGYPVDRTARELLDSHGPKAGWLCNSNDW